MDYSADRESTRGANWGARKLESLVICARPRGLIRFRVSRALAAPSRPVGNLIFEPREKGREDVIESLNGPGLLSDYTGVAGRYSKNTMKAGGRGRERGWLVRGYSTCRGVMRFSLIFRTVIGLFWIIFLVVRVICWIRYWGIFGKFGSEEYAFLRKIFVRWGNVEVGLVCFPPGVMKIKM